MHALLIALVVAMGLAPDQIRTVVMTHTRELRACYDAELARTPGLKGTITITWRITSAGNVEGATVSATTMSNARVEQCIVGVVAAMQFPAADGPTNVAAYPFKFGVGS